MAGERGIITNGPALTSSDHCTFACIEPFLQNFDATRTGHLLNEPPCYHVRSIPLYRYQQHTPVTAWGPHRACTVGHTKKKDNPTLDHVVVVVETFGQTRFSFVSSYGGQPLTPTCTGSAAHAVPLLRRPLCCEIISQLPGDEQPVNQMVGNTASLSHRSLPEKQGVLRAHGLTVKKALVDIT